MNPLPPPLSLPPSGVVLNVTSPEQEQQLEVIEGPLFTGDPVQFELSGLQPCTEYLVDVYAENLAGRGQSVEVAFTTGTRLCMLLLVHCMCVCV